jgi:tol-pal system protein YbgF
LIIIAYVANWVLSFTWGIKYVKFYREFALAVCFSAFCACSTTPEVKEPVQAPKPDEIVELKAKVDDLNNRIFVLTEQLENLKARVPQAAINAPASAPMKPALKTTIKSKTKKGTSAEEEVIAAAKGEGLPEGTVESEMEATAEPTPIAAPVKKPVTIAAPATPSDHANDPMYNEYSSAYKLYQNKEYSKSLVAFYAFVEKYPNSYLTDNAYLWLGESYFQQGEYKMAIDEYQKVMQKFPQGSKTPDAMLKIATSYKMLGDKKNSDKYLDGLISKYPNANAAQYAIRMRSK